MTGIISRPVQGRARMRGLLALLLLGLLLEAQASSRVEDWLERMSEAMRQLNYEGELIYQHGNGLEVLQLVHTVQDGHERERLTALNGVPREIIRDHESVRCVLSGSRAVSVDKRGIGPSFPSLSPMSLNELSAVYQLRFVDDQRVAGREAKGIDIAPRDGLRYGYRLYLDQEHHLPLKQVMLDEQGQRVAQILYSRLRIDPDIPHEASTPSILSKDFAQVQQPSPSEGQASGPRHWGFRQLPKGFQVSLSDLRRDEAGEPVEHLVISDGLATVSLYIEKSRPGAGLEGGSRMGAMSAYGRRVGDARVTVVGEVPAATVRLIAEALEVKR